MHKLIEVFVICQNFRVLQSFSSNKSLQFIDSHTGTEDLTISNSDTERYEIKPSLYNLRIGEKIIAENQNLELGAVYTMIVNRDQSENYVR